MQRILVSAALLLAIVGTVDAAAITVLNPSFELPGAGPGNFPAPTSWTGGGFTERFQDIGNATGGDQVNYSGIDGGTISQDLGVAFLPNSIYTVNFLVGNRAGWDEGLTQYGLKSSANLAVDLGTPVSVDTDTTNVDNTFAEGPTYSFATGAVAPTGNVVVFFRGVTLGAGNRGIVDLARVAVVPEPSSVALFAVGAIGIAFASRRRRRA